MMIRIFKYTFIITFLASQLLLVGCSTRVGGGTAIGAATGAGIGSMIGSGKGRSGAMLGLGVLGAALGNQLFDRQADGDEEEWRREEEYRRRLREDWRRDDYRYRDDDYYYDKRRNNNRRDDYRY
jgi:uncharacterized protein YcfJ